MRLSFLISVIFALNVSASIFSQTIRLEKATDASVRNILKMIEEQSDYTFFYNDAFVDLNRPVKIVRTEVEVGNLLSSIFEDTNLTFQEHDGKFIVIAPKSLLQGISISGTVTDEGGEPMPGVNITVKGGMTGTVSNVDGKYSITVPNSESVLVFSFIGYTTQEVNVGDRTEISLTLSEDTRQIEEVVVVGYGTQKKVNLTGAVSVVDGKDLAARKSASVLTSLQGAMPGVAVLRSTGRPGGETGGTGDGIRIRGVSSTGTADALVLIDGVEGNLTTLNADDIESVSVLKDAAASAIYGARAAAGVILVTTKKGTIGKPSITYNGSFGINLPTYMPERLPAWEEQYFINMSRINASVNAETGEATGSPEMNAERSSWVGNPNYQYRPNGTRWELFGSTNWMDEGLDNIGYTQRHSLSVNGGAEKTRYYMSMGYYGNNGILKYGPDDDQRINARITLDTELNKYLSVDVLASYEGNTVKQSARGSNSILSSLYSARGRQTIYQPEEDTNYSINPYNGDLQANPIDMMKNSGLSKTRTEYYTGKIGLHLKDLVKGLTVDVNFSRRASFYNYQLDKRKLDWLGKDGQGVRQTTGNSLVTKTRYYRYLDKYEGLVNYDLKINRHAFHVLGGLSYEQYKSDQISATANNLLSNDFFSFNFYESGEVANTTISDAIYPWKMASVFGRLNYNFAERYLFEANLRYDGSSRLAPGNRWDLFPSFSGAWRISEETWFAPLTRYVSNLKFRGSWGELGNSSAITSYYPYLGLISNKTTSTSTTITNILGQPAYWQPTMVSNDLTWEILENTNIAVDMTLFGGKLDLTFEYYWKKNKNMMATPVVANIVGAATPSQNIGELKTWGWELSANWRHKIGDVTYRVGFNIDDPQNKLTKYLGENTIAAGTVERLEGYALNTVWGYKTDGYWNSRQEYLDYKAANPGYQSFSDNMVTGGDVKYLAQGEADHTIGVGGATPDDPGDLVYLGNTNGRYLFGISLGAEWKGFDFSMFFQGVGKRNFRINTNTIAPLAYSYEMPWTIHRDYWTEDNPNAMFPRIINQQTYNYQYSDKWVQNGAYIRLKDIQLGYTIPLWTEYIKSLRVYVTGTDVWEHTKVLEVFDPEVVDNTQKNAYYPFFRTWTFGVNLTF